MSIWVRTFCTRSVRDLTILQLQHALDLADFAMMAEWEDLDEGIGYAAEDSLRFEDVERSATRWTVLVNYAHHTAGEQFLHFDLWSDSAHVRAEVDEIRDAMDGREPTQVVELLPRVVETAALELKPIDCAGMGWPIAYHLAMWLGHTERGDGLVEYEGTWCDPKTYEEL